jgi:hypothetical protein
MLYDSLALYVSAAHHVLDLHLAQSLPVGRAARPALCCACCTVCGISALPIEPRIPVVAHTTWLRLVVAISGL